MSNKKKFKSLTLVLLIAYILIVSMYGLSAINLSSQYTKLEKAYIESMKTSLDTIFKESTTEKALQEALTSFSKEYPMDIIVKDKDNKNIYSTTSQTFAELRDQSNKEITLMQSQGIFRVREKEYQVGYNLYHIQNPEYLTNLTFKQITFITLSILVLITVAAVIQYMLYHPLKQAKKTIQKINEYHLDEVIETQVSDEVNEQLRNFAVNLNDNIKNISRDYTELEQGLQIERERLANTITVSRAFVHDLKTPLHQTLLENQLLLRELQELSPQLKTVIDYNVRRTDVVIKNINEILMLMDQNIYDLNDDIESINMSEFVLESRKMFEALLKKKNAYLEFEIEENVHLLTHKITLKLLIHNIFSNAITYASNQSEIFCELFIEGENICFTIQNEADYADIENIRNSETLFSQADKKQTSNEYSSGKGLFLIKELTEILQGKYNVTINENRVTVNVALPKE